MALDMAMREIQTDQTIDVHQCVRNLRSQRVQMVQGLVRHSRRWGGGEGGVFLGCEGCKD